MSETNRGKQFLEFASEVVDHIDKYTVPQYGDAPDDMVETWSSKHIQNQIDKYTKRMSNNQRGMEDNILSCKKIAHYACILQDKLLKGE